MRIGYLADHPRWIRTIAEWHTREWGDVPPLATVADRVAKFRHHLHRDRIPLTVVALDGDTLLGSASLVEEDFPGRADLKPWLASVFVSPEHRRRGVGSALVRHVVGCARELGVPELFLFTWNQEKLYSGLGWRVVERTRLGERDVAIMTIEPASCPAETGIPDRMGARSQPY
jgi:GNAT superfamily N-acetyltransferase